MPRFEYLENAGRPHLHSDAPKAVRQRLPGDNLAPYPLINFNSGDNLAVKIPFFLMTDLFGGGRLCWRFLEALCL